MDEVSRSVLLLTYHFPPEVGGIQTRISKYLDIFPKEGIRLTVYVISNQKPKGTYYFKDGIDVKYFVGGSRFTLRIFAQAISTIYRKRVDVIHVFTGCSTLLGFSFVCLGKLFHRRTIISFFGGEDFAGKTILSRIMKTMSLTLADGTTTNSIYTARYLPAKFISKNRIILGGSERASLTTFLPATNAILYVGRLVKRKGVDDLIRAFKIIRSKIPDATLEIVGDGPERNILMGMVETGDLGIHVIFRGVLTGEALYRAYERSSVVVLPSKRVEDDFADEGLGLSLIEGAMHEKPLVGTKSGGIPEIIADGYNGLLVPENDPDSLADALTKVLLDKELAAELGRNSLKRALQEFTWESSANKLISVYMPSG